jgi:hypothetical protein
MINRRNLLVLAVLLALAVAWFASSFSPAGVLGSRQKKNDTLIAEQMAYHVGVQAYIYGCPLVDMYRQMHNETHRTGAGQQTYAPVNRFYRFPELVGPHNGGNFRAPNNDTLYYTAWWDITEEPLIIHVPDTAGRYYTIAVTNWYSEVSHIGRRTTGTGKGYFALVLPGWEGELPEGVQRYEVETPQGWLLGRMLVDGPDDFDTAMALVEDVWLAPLSEFVPGTPPAWPEPVSATPLDPMRSLGYFEIMNQALKTLPERPDTAALMAQFDAIGVGPNSSFNQAALGPAQKRGLERAIRDGRALVEAATQRTIPDYNGWMISSKIGRYGHDYLHRASVVKGGYGNLPEESLYPAVVFDSDGRLLSGTRHYRLHFEASELPPVNGFWSLAVYQLKDYQLAENAIGRYSIGDRTADLNYNDDGSLTLLLQHTQPGDSGANWLPTPAGDFMAVLRMYEPSAEALALDYYPPRIERLD